MSRAVLRMMLLALLAAIASCGREATPPAPDTPEARALRAQSRLAGLRGVAWLESKRERMPPEWGVSIFVNLYRIAPNEEMAQRFRAALDEALRDPQGEVPSELDAPTLLEPDRLRPLLNELWRRRLSAAPWERDAAALRALVEQNEGQLWAGLGLNHQLPFLHMLHRVDIRPHRTYADIQRELRAFWEAGDADALLLNAPFMYAITHIFYAGSGYFQTRMDPSHYDLEIEIMDRALARYTETFPRNSNFVDISAEILTSRRLLGLPETEASRAITRRLLRLQHTDGSWLRPKGFQDYHATASAVHAFLEYPAEFRRLEP